MGIESVKIMGIESAIKAIESFSIKTFAKPCKVITVKKEGEGWLVLMEMVVADEEMRRYARTPIVGLWEIKLDSDCNINSFERRGLKETSGLSYEEKP